MLGKPVTTTFLFLRTSQPWSDHQASPLGSQWQNDGEWWRECTPEWPSEIDQAFFHWCPCAILGLQSCHLPAVSWGEVRATRLDCWWRGLPLSNKELTQWWQRKVYRIHPDSTRLTCGTSSCHVHHIQPMKSLIVGAHPDHLHGDSTHLKDWV